MYLILFVFFQGAICSGMNSTTHMDNHNDSSKLSHFHDSYPTFTPTAYGNSIHEYYHEHSILHAYEHLQSIPHTHDYTKQTQLPSTYTGMLYQQTAKILHNHTNRTNVSSYLQNANKSSGCSLVCGLRRLAHFVFIVVFYSATHT